ncbi:unnamed protein product [Caenorhabditis bovis]|uniref:Uncharacterized protein n=1 Tax=Caenorhabditis bovis TaxID=2654633 RepID=A0A8S1EQ30_9PELO|nr:unnamed protein product [Caenorhabditis bovis]
MANASEKMPRIDENCTAFMLQAIRIFKTRLDSKAIAEHKLGADLYAVTIIGAFASIIILLMYRSIKPHENSEEQVTLMLASMQMRVEVDELVRRKRKMREAKKRAQDWLRDIRNKMNEKENYAIENLIPTPENAVLVERPISENCPSSNRHSSVSSVPTPTRLDVSLPSRPKSHLGFVPEIIVTEPNPFNLQPPPQRRRRSSHTNFNETQPNTLQSSRRSSESSYNSMPLSVTEEVVFTFPESSSSDSPPWENL